MSSLEGNEEPLPPIWLRENIFDVSGRLAAFIFEPFSLGYMLDNSLFHALKPQEDSNNKMGRSWNVHWNVIALPAFIETKRN